MSCWHGWHGCGPAYGWPGSWRGYGPPDVEPDWCEDVSWPMPRRRRRERPADRETAVSSLEARLEELRAELRRVEAALEEIQRPGAEAAQG